MAPFNSNHWITDPEYIKLVNYIIERTRNVESPMCIKFLAREFKEKSGAARTWKVLYDRIFSFRTKIHTFEHIDTKSKIKMMFALSAPVNEDFMKKLKEDAFVEVDHKQRITHYKSNDENLELKGDQSHSARVRTGMHESIRNLRSIIINYLENKNDADAVPKNRKEKEMENLIEFIAEKCETTDSPLSIKRLMKDFNQDFEITVSLDTIRNRVESYCREMQKIGFLDTLTKVKQLFCLSATLDSDCLEKLRKDADVEVDNRNRITKYAANDGRLTLHGDHSLKAKAKLGWIEWDKKRNAAKKYRNFGDDDGDDYSEEDSDEYSSEEFDSNDHNNIDEFSETKKDDRGNRNTKRKNVCSTASASEKKRNKGTTGFISSNRVGSSSNDSMRPNELDDYDTNYSIDDQVKLEPFRGSIQEDFDEFEEDEDIQQIPKPLQAHDEHNQIEEVPIKVEHEESVEVKPETAHNSRIKFFEAIQSLISCLGTPSLSWIQSKIHRKIQTVGGPDEVMLNDEIVLIIDLLISQIIENSVLNLSENVESMNISNFLCYLKAAIQNSKMSGMEGLMNNISELIEESQNKIIPLEKMANALLATLDDIQQIPRHSQALDEHDRVEEVPIKVEHDEPVDVKPETSHNSKIKFFEALKSLILCLDTPSLSSIQSKIHQKIQTIGGPNEAILNKYIVLVVKPLIFRIINFSIANLSENAESVNLSNFLCYLKAAILNSKMSGMEGLMNYISELIEVSQKKRIPMENVANALYATLDINDRNLLVMCFASTNIDRFSEMTPPISNNWVTAPEYFNLLNYLIKRTENVESPINIIQLVREFKKKSGTLRTEASLERRIEKLRTWIQCFENIDTDTKVKMLFALSVPVNADFLEELKKNALVEVDEKNRITNYESIDWNLELRGDHTHSAKTISAKCDSKINYRKLISDYFENNGNADTIPKNEKEKEMWNLIEFITRKCATVDSPLSIQQLATDFINHFGISRSADTVRIRVKVYCNEIQRIESLDALTKIKQLFCLSATLDSDFLKEHRKNAAVEVDELNRITKYTANNGHLTLNGDHSYSAKAKLGWNEKKKSRNAAMTSRASEGDYNEERGEEVDHPGDDSEEYSSEKFGSELDSENDNNHLDYTEDPVEQLNKEISIGFNLDFDLSTEISHRSEEIEMIEAVEETTNPEITENTVIKTRSGRLSKRRHLDSNFSYDLANSSSSGGSMSSSSSNSNSAKHFHPPFERLRVSKVIEMREDDGRKRKKRDNYRPVSISSNPVGSSSNNSMSPNELKNYATNYSIDDQVKLEPFRGSIQKDPSEFKEDEDIQEIPKSPQAHDKHNKIEEVPIKVETDESKTVENPQEDVKPDIAQAHDEYKELIEFPIKLEHEESVDVKPETSHNPKVKFFEAIQSLILCLDTPSLSRIQSKVHRNIQKLGGSDEVILNNEIILNIDLLIARMTNHSIVNLSNDAESVNFSNFLCYLKAAILNSKINGAEGLVKNISKCIEESRNKRISMGNVENALLATLDFEGF